ncbi:hypothetical protein FCE95_08370 [Luteimonas gilva]|uniref:Uncharacterized protein n=1 Tax=Luteimonas gilva TaxID=2572684 RepID=A0A4U5JNQ4_9GAMM|nr:hypothetical protein [Luteimonas gilva]TKR30151.1 hypothetical protein FCE95_08370 [Luteimonas gilva]
MRRPNTTLVLRACAALIGALLAPFASAQQAPAQEDPGFVIARTVNPRIAYRGIPTEDNPIKVRATTFPAHIFHGTLDNALGDALGDNELNGATGSGGLVLKATRDMLGTSAPIGAAGMGMAGVSAGGGTPLGMGATVGGSVRGATEGLGGTITGALSNAMSQTSVGVSRSTP